MIVGSHRNLEIVNAPDAPLYKVRMDQCDQIILGTPDCCVNGIGIKAADTLRAINLRGFTADLRVSGLDGLDAGVPEVGTNYWLHVVTNGAWVRLVWSKNVNWPTVPANYTHGALVGWNRTDENGHLYQLQKVDKAFAYMQGSYNANVAASGATPGAQFVAIDIQKWVSPQAMRIHFAYGGGTPGSIVAIAASPYETISADYFQQGQGWSANYSRTGSRMLEGRYLMYASSDPAGFLKITGFDDVF